MLISARKEETEMLKVQLELGNLKSRIINAYGPQNDECPVQSRNAQIVSEYVRNLDTEGGNLSQLGMWKLKKQALPKSYRSSYGKT